MCDYSLEMYRSRPAVHGEQYMVHRFHSGTVGFVAPADCGTAVCMPAGARIRLEGLNKAVQRALGVGPTEVVDMIRLPFRAYAHRDGVRFADGREVLLQSINAGAMGTLVPRDLAKIFDLKADAQPDLVADAVPVGPVSALKSLLLARINRGPSRKSRRKVGASV